MGIFNRNKKIKYNKEHYLSEGYVEITDYEKIHNIINQEITECLTYTFHYKGFTFLADHLNNCWVCDELEMIIDKIEYNKWYYNPGLSEEQIRKDKLKEEVKKELLNKNK